MREQPLHVGQRGCRAQGFRLGACTRDRVRRIAAVGLDYIHRGEIEKVKKGDGLFWEFGRKKSRGPGIASGCKKMGGFERHKKSYTYPPTFGIVI